MEPWMGGSTITVVPNPRKRTVESLVGATIFVRESFLGPAFSNHDCHGSTRRTPVAILGKSLRDYLTASMSQETRRPHWTGGYRPQPRPS
jgi:hypothetical protein